MLPTPNTYRTADGSPGPDYWQQKADYKIQVSLNESDHSVQGTETITYYNNSPTPLAYLWLQLDQNLFDKDSDTHKTETLNPADSLNISFMRWVFASNSEGGYKVGNVRDVNGKPLKCTINKTMMRIDLPTALPAKGGKISFSLDWSYKIPEQRKYGGRGGKEYFPKDGNTLYEMAQWFPRLAVYGDATGWQNKQFLGNGEFALTFGDYEVAITVPADHIVASTGELQNATQVLSATHIERLKKAETATEPVIIQTQQEAEVAEKSKATATKTWIYKAKNVRDFAWASSRKFVWDAMRIDLAGKKVWAMSYYPKEGNPLWGQYSTQVVAHTLRVYSRYTIDYPYPVAISVHGSVFGMEYPMISFNGGRPEPDGTITNFTRNAMVGVIIHEVGHNFFPMIINSDERQWTWMDEGLNSFCEYLTEMELKDMPWAKKDYGEKGFPSRRGPAKNITDYMSGNPKGLVPIMVNSEQILQFGNNAYGKPATALNILRETIMGRELFDFAFKQYSQKWAFKHPEPADFFRTMEDASAVDLDWFWRGWFYTTEPCDISLENVRLTLIADKKNQGTAQASPFLTQYYKPEQVEKQRKTLAALGIEFTKADEEALSAGKFFYTLHFKNVGGLIMPVIFQINYEDGTKEIVRIPAEIWRKNVNEVHKTIITQKPAISFQLDPLEETADIQLNNNSFPRKNIEKFEEFKDK
ncbi:MAG: M1 family peptidase [Bacteroidetes bacterium]|nr:MAG: M1 family peptidase [Bacteroidota bacterium]